MKLKEIITSINNSDADLESDSIECNTPDRDNNPEHEAEIHSGNESYEEYPQEPITNGPQPLLCDIDGDEGACMNALLQRSHGNQLET